MDDRKKGGSPINIQTLLLLTAVAGGLYLVPSSLRSSRPGEKQTLERTSRGDQVVPARLWQDPLEAAKNYRDKFLAGLPEAERRHFKFSTNDFHSFHELATQIVRQCQQMQDEYTNETPKITVLMAMISGGTYSEDAETRNRARYAILSALGVAGYVPRDEEHLGFSEVAWPRGADLEKFTKNQVLPLPATSDTKSESGKLIVPFEWFQQSQLQAASRSGASAGRTILVLWLNRDAFSDHPAKRLAQLKRELWWKVDSKAKAINDYWDYAWDIPFILIDPSLRDLLNESFATTDSVSSGNSFSIQEAFNGMKVYSTYATTADTVLRSDFTGNRRDGVKAHLHNHHGLGFFNATCTDDNLAAALCDELERRGVDFKSGRDCIGLVSEWDTLYGRALPLTFAAEVLHRSNTNLYHHSYNAIWALKAGIIDWPSNIFRCSYLRGVDGILPGEGSNKSEANKGKTKESEEPDRPEGHSQLDYMPRLATVIREREGWMKRSNRGRLKAIGILGSDVYDKLLVLQTLRPHFTDELFFTTDLDSRMLHPTEQKWTRNVIVASSFGLKLHRLLQRTTPPFRDTAQTAQYLATLAAVGYLDSLAAVKNSRVSTNLLAELSPRIFEIGRNGAYDLSAPSHSKPIDRHPYAAWLDPLLQTKSPQSYLYPSLPNAYPGAHHLGLYFAGKITWFLVFAAIVSVLVVLVNPSGGALREFLVARLPTWRSRCLTAAALLAFILSLALMVLTDHLGLGGEPFSLADGISIWPTEIISLCATALSVFFILKTRRDLRESKDRLSDDFKLPPRWEIKEAEEAWLEEKKRHGHTADGKESGWRRLFELRYWRWISIDLWDAKEAVIENALKRDANEAPIREASQPSIDGRKLSISYNRLGLFKHRRHRFTLATAIYLALCLLVFWHFGTPFLPYRGGLSHWVHQFVFYLSLTAQVLLTFYVVDATCLCRRFIENLMKGPTVWSSDTLAKFQNDCGIHADYLNDWIDIRVIADRSRVVGKLIFYPFVGLFLIIISRNNFFDRWDWPLPLLLILGLNSAYGIFSVLSLRRAAERARHHALESLNKKLVRVLGGEKRLPQPSLKLNTTGSNLPASEKGEARVAEQIRVLIQEIKDYEEGAFAPLSQHPVVGAILMPFGGAGLVALLDHLAR